VSRIALNQYSTNSYLELTHSRFVSLSRIGYQPRKNDSWFSWIIHL